VIATATWILELGGGISGLSTGDRTSAEGNDWGIGAAFLQNALMDSSMTQGCTLGWYAPPFQGGS